MPAQDRALLTDIWYPTTPNASPLDVDLGGVVNAPRTAAAASLPLLLFSHGNCSLPTLSRFFMRALASYGFIIAAPLHAGDLLTDPDCGTNDGDGIANRPADTGFVIDSLLQLNTDPTSFFSGAIDPRRIGMSGRSYGGSTTLRVSDSDPRVIAGLLMASPVPPISLAKIHAPVSPLPPALGRRGQPLRRGPRSRRGATGSDLHRRPRCEFNQPADTDAIGRETPMDSVRCARVRITCAHQRYARRGGRDR